MITLTKPPTADAIKTRLKSAFQLFEAQKQPGFVDEREIPTIIRSLDVNPSQEQLRTILEEVRDEDQTSGMVEYSKLESVLVKQFMDMPAAYVRDTEDRILRAFRAFDTDEKGYIEADTFKTIMTARGDAFRQEEAEVMLSACVENGRIYYEDFARMLAEDKFEKGKAL